MAFQSDSKQLRTWDSETGWELRRVPTGPDMVKFELRHPVHAWIHFYGDVTLEETDERSSAGRPVVKSIYVIKSVNGPPRNASAFQKQLIKEALYAFGYIYNGPSGPVEVIYDT